MYFWKLKLFQIVYIKNNKHKKTKLKHVKHMKLPFLWLSNKNESRLMRKHFMNEWMWNICFHSQLSHPPTRVPLYLSASDVSSFFRDISLFHFFRRTLIGFVDFDLAANKPRNVLLNKTYVFLFQTDAQSNSTLYRSYELEKKTLHEVDVENI